MAPRNSDASESLLSEALRSGAYDCSWFAESLSHLEKSVDGQRMFQYETVLSKASFYLHCINVTSDDEGKLFFGVIRRNATPSDRRI